MFEKGEYVVYGTKGVCCIQDIGHVDLPGVERDKLFYILHPVQDNHGTVYLPIDSTKAVIRRVMTAEEAKELLQEIPSIEELVIPSEKQRESSYKEALRTCSTRSWVSMIKTLYLRRNKRLAAGKKVTSLDERYLRAAEHELYGELSVALGVPKEDLEPKLKEAITGICK